MAGRADEVAASFTGKYITTCCPALKAAPAFTSFHSATLAALTL